MKKLKLMWLTTLGIKPSHCPLPPPRTPPEVFWCLSLYGIPTYAAKLCNVRWTNTCVSLVKNPSSCVLSCACFSRTSSLLCLLQWNVPSWVCLSLSPVSTSGKHSFTCLPQQNTIQHNWLSKEPLSFHFRNLFSFRGLRMWCCIWHLPY